MSLTLQIVQTHERIHISNHGGTEWHSHLAWDEDFTSPEKATTTAVAFATSDGAMSRAAPSKRSHVVKGPTITFDNREHNALDVARQRSATALLDTLSGHKG